MPRISTASRLQAQAGHPDDCDCCQAAAPAQQNIEELAFLKSACSAAKAGDLDKLRRCIEKQPASVHGDGSGGGPLHRCDAACAGNQSIDHRVLDPFLQHLTWMCAAQVTAATRRSFTPPGRATSTWCDSCCRTVSFEKTPVLQLRVHAHERS